MNKTCIFNEKKLCDECGDCMRCDLDSSKLCNNCGKCLEMEGYDLKAIKIDDIIDDTDEAKVVQKEGLVEDNSDFLKEDSPLWEFIDDIKDIKDIETEDILGNKKLDMHEEYPGLIVKGEGSNKVNIKNYNEVLKKRNS